MPFITTWVVIVSCVRKFDLIYLVAYVANVNIPNKRGVHAANVKIKQVLLNFSILKHGFIWDDSCTCRITTNYTLSQIIQSNSFKLAGNFTRKSFHRLHSKKLPNQKAELAPCFSSAACMSIHLQWLLCFGDTQPMNYYWKNKIKKEIGTFINLTEFDRLNDNSIIITIVIVGCNYGKLFT